MIKPNKLILLIDVPVELATQVQKLAAQYGVEVALIHVADALPVAGVPVVPIEPTPAPVAIATNVFQLIEPIYDCKKHEITFRSNAPAGSGVEYRAPGVIGWTKNPGPHPVDKPVTKDSSHLTLCARLDGVEAAPYQFGFKAYCAAR